MRSSFSVCWVLGVVLFAASAGAADAAKSTSDRSPLVWGHIELSGAIHDGPQLPGLFGELTDSLDGTLARLDKAADDPQLKGLILNVNSPHIGWGSLGALRQAVARVRAKGKKVHAYLDGGTTMDYLLASACDEITMPESGVLMVLGLRAEVSFYKKLFDMIGVQADMLRVGEFKSAAEPYSRTEMSPEFRKEMEEILDDYYRQIQEMIGKSRNLPADKVLAAIDAGPQTARKARELGLIDRVGYADEMETAIEQQTPEAKLKITRKYGKKKVDTDFSGFSGMMKFLELLMGVEPPARKNTAAKIAVIHASGPIMTGKSQSELFSDESTVGSETLVKAIHEARLNDSVKAIVLRVNSPGGSALASDLIWRELELVKKPFVVSMGDVAASGGYYISQGADRIFAEPGTLTGSICVVGGKLALGGVYEKIGITTSVISRGKNSGIFSGTTGFTASERESMQQLLNEVYDQFTGKAAQGRKMSKEQLEKLARGRVYTGAMALKLNLVDELGSLDDAVAAAKKMAGLKPEDKVERLTLPKAVSPLEQLFGPLDPNAEAHTAESRVLFRALRGLSPELEQEVRNLQTFGRFSAEPVLMILPFRLTVR